MEIQAMDSSHKNQVLKENNVLVPTFVTILLGGALVGSIAFISKIWAIALGVTLFILTITTIIYGSIQSKRLLPYIIFYENGFALVVSLNRKSKKARIMHRRNHAGTSWQTSTCIMKNPQHLKWKFVKEINRPDKLEIVN